MHAYNRVLTILGLACFLYLVFCVSVKVKLKAVLKMTYTVSGGTLNPTHLLTFLPLLACSASSTVCCIRSTIYSSYSG